MKPLLPCLLLMLHAASALSAEPVQYLRDVKPILTKYCVECHGPQKQRAGLRLDTAAAALQGSNAGPVVVPKDGAKSLLVRALLIQGESDGELKRMPPKEPRPTAAEIALLRRWIEEGAVAPLAKEESAPTANPQSTHWSFRAPVRVPFPTIANRSWARNPIDLWILAKLEANKLVPSPEASKATLLRRLSLDLIGLPPTPAEVTDFQNDNRPDAYERQVERLLDSPHYGERWGRHWLDQARYADSNGFNIDAPRNIWKYRDWVIDALNRDLPFDRFTIEQLAGDLLPQATLEQKVATGFQRNTLINQEGGIDVEQFRVESVVDRVSTTGSVFLGLTVGCAQCHDHKYDPISQREFYQLFAFYNNADEPNLDVAPPDQVRMRDQHRVRLSSVQAKLRALEAVDDKVEAEWEIRLTPELRAKLPKAIQTILTFPENGRSAKQKESLSAAFRKMDQARHVVAAVGLNASLSRIANLRMIYIRNALDKERADLKKREPTVVTTMVMAERKTPRQTYIHLAGDFLRKGVPVSPGTPSILPPLAASGPMANRLDLAKWLVDGRNPLTARVVVNRAWQAYFGTGIVETENDFGTQGTPPSHPELLDWMALEFMRQNWSLKSLHRLIVNSATYRQSSKHRPELQTVDPRNRLLARQNRLRLEGEIVRDVGLAASGLLSSKIGGPSVFPPQPDGVYRFTQVQRDWKPNDGPDRYRRGMYTHFWRSAPYPALTVFDAPDSTTSCTRRNRSNTPLQALTLLNDQAFHELALALARRLVGQGAASEGERIRGAFRLCLGREPKVHEEASLTSMLRRFEAQPSASEKGRELEAWTLVARVLLNLDEFITRE